MRILLVGSDNLAVPLRKLGQSVWTCAPEASADLPLDDPDPPWAKLEKLGQAKGLTWDAIVVTDHLGGRRLPTGLTQAPAVTAFWGLDAPLNDFWQRAYAALFDLACLDQPGQADELAGLHPGARWLPVGVAAELYQGEPPVHQEAGVCFVGVINEAVRPKRSALLNKVARLAPLQVRGGRQGQWFATKQAANLYRSHQVVLNENLFPGLTTRPLEAMAAGGCLLSEAAPGAMDCCFNDGEHLAYFGPNNLEQKLDVLVGDEALRRRLARSGREEVLGGHTLRHRAAQLLAWLEEMAAVPLSERPRARAGLAQLREGQALLGAGLRWPREGGGRRLLRACGRLQAGAADGAPPLAARRAAGRALLAAKRTQEALGYLAQAGEMGGTLDRLAWGLAAWDAGQKTAARQALDQAGLSGLEPGQALFHHKIADILSQHGQTLEAGFDLRSCAPPFWTALEHLLESTRLEPDRRETWEALGDLLTQKEAPNQAAVCYERALSLGAGTSAAQGLERARVAGYIL